MPRKMAREPATDATAAVAAAPRKIDSVLALLSREEGASLDELVGATGWLPHTTRAALTGLRKKGHVISKAKVGCVARYTVAAAPTQ